MYGIFTYIYHTHQLNVGKYTSPMDPMDIHIIYTVYYKHHITVFGVGFPCIVSHIYEDVVFFLSFAPRTKIHQKW